MTSIVRPMLSWLDHRRAVNVFNVSALLVAAVFGLWLVGFRGIDVGTDTRTYTSFFESLSAGLPDTRLEPGFVYISYVLRKLGLSVIQYQVALFVLLLGMVFLAARAFHAYLRADSRLSTYLVASLALLYLSPMFVNGAINALRQGLAALLIFAALLAFLQRKWWLFVLFGGVATSFHYSSPLYLVFAPLLLLRRRWSLYLAALAFLLYVSGASMAAIRIVLPGLYTIVNEYTANAEYRTGVRIDFALFSIFWYVVAQLLLPLVQERYRAAIAAGATIYLIMLLPFFAIGWGSFSNRYLLPGWLSISLVLAAILCCGRVRFLRNPLLLQGTLLASCAAFYAYVSLGIVI